MNDYYVVLTVRSDMDPVSVKDALWDALETVPPADMIVTKLEVTP
jgi:hypothetical protein